MKPTQLTLALLLVTLLGRAAQAEPLALDPFRANIVRRANAPLVEAAHLLERRLQDLRCALPDSRVYGNLSDPGVEVCASPDGVLRICMGAKVSLRGDLAASTASVFLTDRPGICPGRHGF